MGEVVGMLSKEGSMSVHAGGGGIVEGTVILWQCLKWGEADFMEDIGNFLIKMKTNDN